MTATTLIATLLSNSSFRIDIILGDFLAVHMLDSSTHTYTELPERFSLPLLQQARSGQLRMRQWTDSTSHAPHYTLWGSGCMPKCQFDDMDTMIRERRELLLGVNLDVEPNRKEIITDEKV